MQSDIRVPEGSRPAVSWPLIQSSLWLRGGVLGIGVALLGISLIFTGESDLGLGITMFAAGAIFGVYALRRSWLMLDSEGKPAPSYRAPSFGATARNSALSTKSSA